MTIYDFMMASVSAKLDVLLFLGLALLASSFSGMNALQISSQFDSFVLFGHIHPFNFKKTLSYRLQLFVELGSYVWLQDVESKYYILHIPARNYSGLMGRLSLLARDESVTTLWNQSFSVQSDVGAYRLDIADVPETFITTRAGKIVNGISRMKSNQRLQQTREQEAPCVSHTPPKIFITHPSRETNFTGVQLPEMQTGNREVQMIYPGRIIFYGNTVKQWRLVSLVACFALIQLSVALLRKGILPLEAYVPAGNQSRMGSVISSDHTDAGVWQLCANSTIGNEGCSLDSGSSQDLPDAGRSPLEEAWHAAEQYLNGAIDNDCQGAYFSYNCTVPQQETPESAPGRWNRDNAGRLIRQLWA